MQQNSICRLYGNRDETINPIISECSEPAWKVYKTTYDGLSRVTHWVLRKKFKFDHRNKWYMHNLTSVLENKTHKLLWDFDIQTDHLISARRPNLLYSKPRKRTCRNVDFSELADHRVKLKESEKKDKYLDLVSNLKKSEEHERDVYTNYN